MQSKLFEPTSLPALPEPGFFESRVLESPLPLALTLIAIGILIFATLRHTKHANRIGKPSIVIGFFAGLGIFLAGHFITTDRELLKERSNQLVQAVANQDISQLNILLSSDIEVKASFFKSSGKPRVIDQIASQGRSMVDSASLRAVNAGLLGTQVARTQIKVRVSGDMLPPLSWWSVDWTRSSPDSNDWVATHIKALWIQGFSNP